MQTLSNQERWARIAADPDRARKLAAARQREAERLTAAAAAPRIVVLAPAPAGPVGELQRPQLVSNAGRVDLYEEIDPWFGVGAAEFCAAIAKVPGDLECHVSSVGGNLFEALAIYNALKQRAGLVTIVIDGLAASAASVICMAASPGRLFAAEASTAMVHDALAPSCGNEQDHYEIGKLLGRESDNLSSIYAARTGGTAAQWREVMRAETWYIGGPEIVAAGLADKVLQDGDSAPEPGSWADVAAQLDTKAKVTGAGPGTAGSPAVRAAVYDRWTAQTGRGRERVSPAVAAVFRL